MNATETTETTETTSAIDRWQRLRGLPFCHETYCDALTWTPERRRAQLRGNLDFLRTAYDRTRPEFFDGIFEENRALHLADSDVAAGHPYRSLPPTL